MFQPSMNLGHNLSKADRSPAKPPRAAVLRAVLVVLGLLCASGSRSSLASEVAWHALQGGGMVVLLRHAQAPGTGDPPGFRLGDCSTQRNLSSQDTGSRFHSTSVPAIRRAISRAASRSGRC